MTEIEVKALEWAAKWESKFVTPYPQGRRAALVKIFYEQLRTQEATEARHAAELREQAERFSEAASLTLRMLTPYLLAKDEAEDILTPFILPKPDPLVEVLHGIFFNYAPENAQADADALRAAIEARGGKIVWEAGND